MLILTKNSKSIMDFLKKDQLINLNIMGIIENEPNVNIFVDNVENPKGIVVDNGDNSLGIMYTKKEHRRMGYAEDVTIDLAAKHIAQGKIPFLHIIERNNMSPGLAKKCGFVECGKVVWFGIKVGNPG